MRAAVERAREALPPADVVRMLALLSEAETGIRRSASARLLVETLLLRWTLMDRTVEIEKVIAGIPGGGSAAPAASRPQGDRRPQGERVPSSAPPAAPRLQGEKVALTLEALLGLWPEILESASEKSRLLGQSLAVTTPVAAERGEVRLSVPEGQGVPAEGVRRQLAVVEELIGSRFLGTVQVRVEAAAPGGGAAEPPKRMTGEGLRAERLARLRRIDPALDAAANELDLEIVDEG
jgi:hypothetical protein